MAHGARFACPLGHGGGGVLLVGERDPGTRDDVVGAPPAEVGEVDAVERQRDDVGIEIARRRRAARA